MKIKDIEELFESLVRVVPAYPVTLFNVYVAQNRVLKIPRDMFTCHPGIALMFSFIFGYFAFMYLTGRMKTGTQMFDRPPLSWLMFSVVFTALVIALQRVFLRMLVRLSAPLSGRTESEEKRLATDLAALSYA